MGEGEEDREDPRLYGKHLGSWEKKTPPNNQNRYLPDGQRASLIGRTFSYFQLLDMQIGKYLPLGQERRVLV